MSQLLARRSQDRRQRFGTMAAGVALLALGLDAEWEARGWQAEPAAQQLTQHPAETDDAIVAHRVFVVAQQAHLIWWLSRRVGHPLRAGPFRPRLPVDEGRGPAGRAGDCGPFHVRAG